MTGKRRTTAVALTVAGSDSGGGAGIQADLKTFHARGVFGTSAITCVTAQNPDEVTAIQALRPALVTAQIDRVFDAFRVGGAKTGMLYNAAIIEAVAEAFQRRPRVPLVVDPVMIATSGAVLLQKKAQRIMADRLFPRAIVVTPNLAEAELLAGHRIDSRPAQRAAACALADEYQTVFLVKGGHLPVNGRVVDVLYDGREIYEFGSAHVRGAQPHGAGCTFAAAIAAELALGQPLIKAVARAKRLIARAIANPLRLGRRQALRV